MTNKHTDDHKKKISYGVLKHWDKKGRTGGIGKNGYRTIGGYLRRKYEHRIVMELHIGRELRSDEHVHHINGNKLDNRIDNLEIISISDHMRDHAIKNGLGKDRVGVSPTNKLSKKQVDKIIDLRKQKHTMKEISEILKVSATTIHKYCSIYKLNKVGRSRWKKISN